MSVTRMVAFTVLSAVRTSTADGVRVNVTSVGWVVSVPLTTMRLRLKPAVPSCS